MMDKYTLIGIKKSTKDKLPDCIDEYLDHHPEMRGMKITVNKIIYEMMKFYLKGSKREMT